ncbi:MAG: type III pantothenate kinase [Burkholderiaceae bacterium]|nr:type III pantothenate kinase [Burkholderiaceae bacterium]
MLLLIDAGNSMVKWAMVGADASGSPGRAPWFANGEQSYSAGRALAAVWQSALRGGRIKRVIVSNVAGKGTRDMLSEQIDPLDSPRVEWFESARFLAGVRNGYAEPAQLGSDRFASLIGARTLFPDTNLVVVTCGTATTIDVLTKEGFFPGGLILPGLRLMASALADNTALLPAMPDTSGFFSALATDTVHAIGSGCLTAQAGAIEYTVRVHAAQLMDVTCLLSGGASGQIASCLSIPFQVVDNLVMIGLHVADAEKNRLEQTC